MINQLTSENPNSIIVDSGNLSTDAKKLDIITSIMSDLKYDAIGMGIRDIRLADDFLKHTAENDLVVLDPLPGARESTVPYIIKDVGGVRVGVVSFTGEAVNPSLGGSDYGRLRALYAAYKAARDGSDILILLDQANRADKDWIERNGPRLGFPDVVIGGIARTRLAGEQIVGRTRIVPTAVQARKLGVVDITLVPGEEPKVECRTILLDQKVPADEAVAKKIEEFTLNAKNTATAARAPTSPHGNFSGFAASKPYYSSQLCKACHTSQYDDWQKTKHAAAIQSLVSADRNEPECLTCHSEMFRTIRNAHVPKAQTGGVECATCHKRSIPHGNERRDTAIRMKVDRRVCLECHTNERSPSYDEQAYFAKVAHKAAPTADAPKTVPSPKQAAVPPPP